MTSETLPLTHPLDRWLRIKRLPHTYCAGCSIGTILSAYTRALERLDMQDRIVTISGIGCTGRASGYINTDGFHTTHGRAIPFAFGVKSTNPRLEVVVLSGDGDLFSIGGNHFIHAARRNLDLTVICVNNFTYGMTGGQVAPTTPPQAITTTTPQGASLRPFNLAHLAAGAGAAYVARYAFHQQTLLARAIVKGIQKNGLAFIEVVSICPVLFGKRNRLSTAEMYQQIKSRTVKITKEEKERPILAPIEFETGKGYQRIPVGEFVNL
ncbi:MAG: thiamine pyrophosphate-dependent enzyme [Candidatus Heimdallarchaeota archaeon]